MSFQSENDSSSNTGGNHQMGNRLQLFSIILIVCLYASLSSFYKIETSEQGVVTRFGAFSHIADEGLNFKLPFGIDQVYKVEVTRIQQLEFGGRKNSSGYVNQDSSRLESLMLTGDLNVAVVGWILQYKIIDPKKYIFHAKDVEKNIRNTSTSVMRRVVGDKLVSDVLTTDRVKIADQAKTLTQEVLDRYDMGIHITKINLRNVTPPEPVKPAFNEINIAKQEKEKMINQAKEKYNQVIPKAEGTAKQMITEAEAYAINLINKAKGDSSKFELMLKAYKKSPVITKSRLYLEAMERILVDSEKITVVDAKVQGVLPVFNQMSDNTISNVLKKSPTTKN